MVVPPGPGLGQSLSTRVIEMESCGPPLETFSQIDLSYLVDLWGVLFSHLGST